jgi:hypothetical protein
MYTKSLTVITLKEALHRTINKRVAKANVKQTPSFITNYCPSSERKTSKKRKTLNLKFREANNTFRV